MDLQGLKGKKGSLGMQNLVGRAGLLGASIDLQSQPGKGFQADIQLPIPPKK